MDYSTSAIYDPVKAERDACGIGFVADARGRSSRAMVDNTLDALMRVRHRGALNADALTGDGAGVLLPLPTDRAVFGVADAERAGIAMCFLDPVDPSVGRSYVEQACIDEGLTLDAWRPVPVDESALGDQAKVGMPSIEQAIIIRPEGFDEEDGERRAFRARRRAEDAARAAEVRLYIASFSFRTITYKALCAADQLAAFYPDLADERYEAWFGIFHQRFATNTTPTW